MANDWSGIGIDLVQLIAEEALKNGVRDLVSMAAVCRWWRDCLLGQNGWIRRTLMAVSPPDHFPKLMLPEKLPNAVGDPNDDRDYIHRGVDTYFRLHLPELRGSRCCGSGYGWLVTARDDDFVIRLVNPITRQQIQLPGIPFFWSDDDGIPEFEMEEPMELFMRKAIVIDDPSESWRGYTVATVIFGRLFCLVNRRGAKIWLRVVNHEMPCTDIAHYRGVIYWLVGEDMRRVETCCMTTAELLWYAELHHSPIPANIWNHYARFRSYLLQVSKTKIYGVSRPLQLLGHPLPENGSLVVFRLYPRRGWARLMNLGNLCLFFGDNTSMALSPVPANSGFRQNHVYFTRSCMNPPETGGFDWCSYDMGSGTYERHSFVDAAAYSLTPSLWVAFNPRRAGWI